MSSHSYIRTYGRSGRDAASKAFDDMLADKPTSTGTTCGRSSYRSVEKNSSETDPKRPRLSSDPFSFDSDEEKSSSPKKTSGGRKKLNPVKAAVSPPKTFYGTRKTSKYSEKNNTEISENDRKPTQKTYSYTARISKNGIEAKLTFSKGQLNSKTKQMSLEDTLSRKTASSKFLLKSRNKAAADTLPKGSVDPGELGEEESPSDVAISSQDSTKTRSTRSNASHVTISSSGSAKDSSQKSSLFEDSGHDTDPVSSDDEPVFFKHTVKRTFSKVDSCESSDGDTNVEATSPVKVDHPYSVESPVAANSDHSYVHKRKTSPNKNTLNIKAASERNGASKPAVKSPSTVKNKVFRQVDLDAKERPQVKAMVFKSPNKNSSPVKAAYNARQWTLSRSRSEQGEQPSTSQTAPPGGGVFDANFDDTPTLKRTVTWPKKAGLVEPKTAVKVNKDQKQLFTVVRNVQEAHECQERGEAQEFEDDLEYIMDGMKDTQSVSVRCLSTISLAQKCTMPAFRMHLRAHGTLIKIFALLHDASSYSSLALCVGLVMYMMSRDRLNMDLDKASLQLMLKLLSVSNHKSGSSRRKASEDKDYDRTREKAASICETLQKEGGAKDLDLTRISTNYLAMEALLSLTSKKAGDWFTEELRLLNGLDHIIEDIHSSIDVFIDEGAQDLDDASVERLSKVDRWLKVLENVSFMSTENQTFMVDYSNGMLIRAVCRALKICEGCISVYSQELGELGHTGRVILECMLAILRVLLNLTHDNEHASLSVGEQDGLINTALLCVLQSPQYVPIKERFDILVLGVGLLINLVEHSDLNRRRLLTAETVSSYDSITQEDCMDAPEALVQLFLQKLEAARQMEKEEDISEESPSDNQLDESGEWHESEDGVEWVGSQRSRPAGSSQPQGSQEEVDLTEGQLGVCHCSCELIFMRPYIDVLSSPSGWAGIRRLLQYLPNPLKELPET